MCIMGSVVYQPAALEASGLLWVSLANTQRGHQCVWLCLRLPYLRPHSKRSSLLSSLSKESKGQGGETVYLGLAAQAAKGLMLT